MPNRFLEFSTANIRNPHTRKAYYRAASEFFDWCDQARLGLLETAIGCYTFRATHHGLSDQRRACRSGAAHGRTLQRKNDRPP